MTKKNKHTISVQGSCNITNTQRSSHKSHWTSDVSFPKVSFLRKTSSNSTAAFRRFYELGYTMDQANCLQDRRSMQLSPTFMNWGNLN